MSYRQAVRDLWFCFRESDGSTLECYRCLQDNRKVLRIMDDMESVESDDSTETGGMSDPSER